MKRRCRISMLLLILITLQGSESASQDLTPPDPATVEALPAVSPSPDLKRRELPDEALQLIRDIAVLLLPSKFEDEDGWGEEKRIQSGLDVDFEDGRLKTRRRWKNVNHGSWLQGSGELVEPETTFTVTGAMLPDPADRTHRYEIRVSARLRVTGRQQQWNYGVMLWSLSADAVADVSLLLIVDVKSEVVSTDQGTRLRFEPNVAHAAASLDRFSLRRISHAKGAAVHEFGEFLEQLIRLRVRSENKDLASRINKSIRKNPDRLEVPLNFGEWFGWSSEGEVNSETSAVGEGLPGLPSSANPDSKSPEEASSPPL